MEVCISLVNTIAALNKNAFVLILNLFSVSTKIMTFHGDNKCSIYSEVNKGPDGNIERLTEILSTFNLSHLFSKEVIQ